MNDFKDYIQSMVIGISTISYENDISEDCFENLRKYEETSHPCIYEILSSSFSENLANQFLEDIKNLNEYIKKYKKKIHLNKIDPLSIEERIDHIPKELHLKYLIFTKLYLSLIKNIERRLLYIVKTSTYNDYEKNFTISHFKKLESILKNVYSIPDEELIYLIILLEEPDSDFIKNELKKENFDLISDKNQRERILREVLTLNSENYKINKLDRVIFQYLEKMFNIMHNKKSLITFIDLFISHYELDYLEVYPKIKDMKKVYFVVVNIIMLYIAREIDDILKNKINKTNTFKDDSQFLISVLKDTNKKLKSKLINENKKSKYLDTFLDELDDLFQIWISIIRDVNKQKTNKAYKSLKYILENKEQFDDLLNMLPIHYKYKKIEDDITTVKALLLYIFYTIYFNDIILYKKDVIKNIFTMKGTTYNGEKKSILDHRTYDKYVDFSNPKSIHYLFGNL